MGNYAKLLGLGSLLFIAYAATAQEPEVEVPAESGQVGRYQVERISDGRVLVIDTATGQCWSKYLGNREWSDEGNPAKGRRQPRPDVDERTAVRSPAREPYFAPSSELPTEITIRQRGWKPIPDSEGTLVVHLGDITEGQVIVSIRDEAANVVVEEKSLGQGEAMSLFVQSMPYVLEVIELRNLLTGDDFATLRVARAVDDGSEEPTPAEPTPAEP